MPTVSPLTDEDVQKFEYLLSYLAIWHVRLKA